MAPAPMTWTCLTVLPLPASLLHLLAQEEHADQVLRGRRHHQPGERGLLGLQHRGLVAAMLLPEIDQRVGRGIMLAAARPSPPRCACAWRASPRTGPKFRSVRQTGPAARASERPNTASFTALRTWRSCVTASTRPSDFARRASMVRPVSISVIACIGLTSAREARGAAEAGMQAEHHLRESRSARRRSRCATGRQRDFEPAAEAEAVDHRDGRQSAALRAGRSPHARGGSRSRPSSGSVAPRNSLTSAPAMKPDVFAERITRPAGALGLERREHGIELLHHVRGQRVGAGACAVEQQPGDAVGVARQLEVLDRARRSRACGPSSSTRSPRTSMILESMVTPSRSAWRRPARRRCIRWRCRACVPSRFIALTRCSTMRLPLVPTGWPRLMAPPSTLSLVAVDLAGRAVEAEHLAAELVVVPGGEAAEHLRGKGLVQLPGLDVLQREVIALQAAAVADSTGPRPMIDGIERRPLAVDDDGLRRQAVLWRPPLPRRG